MWQATDTASLGMSSQMTEPPMGLLTHLQSHSGEVTEAGAGNNKSAICGNKYQANYYLQFFCGAQDCPVPMLCCHHWMGAVGSWNLGKMVFVLLGSEVG